MCLSSLQPIKYFSVPYLYRVISRPATGRHGNILPVPLAGLPVRVFSLATCRRHVSLCLTHSLCLGTLRCRPGLWPFPLYLSLNRTSRTHCAFLIPFVTARFAVVQVSHTVHHEILLAHVKRTVQRRLPASSFFLVGGLYRDTRIRKVTAHKGIPNRSRDRYGIDQATMNFQYKHTYCQVLVLVARSIKYCLDVMSRAHGYR